jgi:hypothetical protein
MFLQFWDPYWTISSKNGTGMFLAPVYFFGAKVGTSFSRQNVTISKNKKHTIFRNLKLYPVRKFRDIPTNDRKLFDPCRICCLLRPP